MSGLEGHSCWEDCDEGPHGCICGNECEPPPWWSGFAEAGR